LRVLSKSCVIQWVDYLIGKETVFLPADVSKNIRNNGVTIFLY